MGAPWSRDRSTILVRVSSLAHARDGRIIIVYNIASMYILINVFIVYMYICIYTECSETHGEHFADGLGPLKE